MAIWKQTGYRPKLGPPGPRTPRIQFKKKVAHRIGYCQKCGWVHKKIKRIRTEEGDTSVVKPLCVDCVSKYRHQVICNLCGRTNSDNLYPVPVIRKVINSWQSCAIFLHLCPECRKINHQELLKRLKLPEDICDSCGERFKCYTSKGDGAIPQSASRTAIIGGKKTTIHKSTWS